MGVSVIVPIFNGEKTIEKCIESLLKQDIQELEIVLVDDGSIDKSGELCDDYSKRCNNIKVIHQENKGLARARLTGCIHAKYERIAFVDCDDYVEPFLLKLLDEKMTSSSADLVVSHLIYDFNESVVRSNLYMEAGIKKRDDALEYLFGDELGRSLGVEITMCGKLFRKNYLIEALNEISICKSYGEDLEELLRYIKQIETILLVDEWGYHYVKQTNSMSNTADLKNYGRIKELYDVFNFKDEWDMKNTVLRNQANLFIRFLLQETTSLLFPNIELGYILYVPPYEIIPQNSRLIVYGAGRVGKSMVKCLKSSGYADIIAWVDANKRDSIYSIEVSSPEVISRLVYDYILIAVSIEDFVDQIRKELELIGVPKEKILWKKPYCG